MSNHATYARLQTLMLRAVEATPPTTRPLYPKGKQPGPVPPPRPMPATAARMAAAAKHWDVERCLECMSEVVTHRDLQVWNCVNLACARHGWCETILGRAVRVVDKGVTA